MELKSKILAATGRAASYKQTNYLRVLTGLPFWKPESEPAPNGAQASLLIEAILEYIKTHENGDHVIEAIQIWFPSFDNIAEVKMHFFRKGGKSKTEPETENAEQNPEHEKTTTTTKTRNSKPEAKKALREFIKEVNDAFKNGDMDQPYDHDCKVAEVTIENGFAQNPEIEDKIEIHFND